MWCLLSRHCATDLRNAEQEIDFFLSFFLSFGSQLKGDLLREFLNPQKNHFHLPMTSSVTWGQTLHFSGPLLPHP